MNFVSDKRVVNILTVMPKVGKRKARAEVGGVESADTPAKNSRTENTSRSTAESREKSKYFGDSKVKLSRDTGTIKNVTKTTTTSTVALPLSTVTGSANSNSERLMLSFYERNCEELAKALLGQSVVTVVDGKRLSGMIVETEAYLGHVDKAAHSYNGKRTPKNEAMFMPPGTAYVYNIYGMYCCLNISSQGEGCAVLIRALQPLENLETMDQLRTKGKPDSSFMKKNGRELCNGPSKLCQALGIKKDAVNLLDLCKTDLIWLEKGDPVNDSDIVKCPRININYAEDWVDKPLRFYVQGNDFVSVKYKGS